MTSREKKSVSRCRGDDSAKPTYCIGCRIKNCNQMAKGKTGYYFT